MNEIKIYRFAFLFVVLLLCACSNKEIKENPDTINTLRGVYTSKMTVNVTHISQECISGECPKAPKEWKKAESRNCDLCSIPIKDNKIMLKPGDRKTETLAGCIHMREPIEDTELLLIQDSKGISLAGTEKWRVIQAGESCEDFEYVLSKDLLYTFH